MKNKYWLFNLDEWWRTSDEDTIEQIDLKTSRIWKVTTWVLVITLSINIILTIIRVTL